MVYVVSSWLFVCHAQFMQNFPKMSDAEFYIQLFTN